ncbi:hypothetical protein ACFYY2_04080 [Streptomyces sp. NPDC001822]|uniref:hypothetical protein n=1 Tax=Streptomyces sp. NPDC001822 TaxID=3364614 RepID=UPI0036C44D4D
MTGRAEPTSGTTGMGRDRDAEGASAGVMGAGRASGTAVGRTTGGRAVPGASGMRDAEVAEVGAGTEAVVLVAVRGWGECGAVRVRDRCSGSAPPGRPDPGASFTTV